MQRGPLSNRGLLSALRLSRVHPYGPCSWRCCRCCANTISRTMEAHEERRKMKAALTATCRALFPPGQVTELRVLDIPGRSGFRFNAAGWFDSPDMLVNAAIHYHKMNPNGIYVTINAVHSACLARTGNKMEERRRDTTSDRDIIRRHWLPIDLDPVRPSGVSTTNEELKHALDAAAAVARDLETARKFPSGLRAHSSNGVHLLYRIDLPNDDVSREIVKGCLAALAKQFDSPEIKVDTGLFNAARILKFWGTATRKGKHTPDRPHRLSKLWTARNFADVGIVTPTQLRDLAGQPAARPRKSRPKKGKTVAKAAAESQASRADSREFKFDLDAWIERHGIRVIRTEPFDGSGVRYILEHCLFDDSHVGTSAILGRAPSGAIFYRCQHQSCSGRDWSDAKALFSDSGPQVPGKAPEGPKTPSSESGDAEDESSPWEVANRFIDEEFADDDLGRVTLRRHRETFYRYNPKRHVYAELSADALRVMITRWLGEAGLRNTTRAVLDVMNGVASVITGPDELEMPFRCPYVVETRCVSGDRQVRNWLTLKNGILDVDRAIAGDQFKDCLSNHTSDWLSTTALNFEFPVTKEAGRHDHWLRFLAEVLQDDQDRVAVIQEMFGYCFFRSTKLEKFFILQGNGCNGKSTILALLEMLLGSENVSTLSMDQLADARLRYHLYGATANICSDLPEMDRVEEGLLKRVTSGEAIVCDRKYKASVQFVPTVKLIFSTNPLPRFGDTSLGIWRRMLLVPFEYVVPPDKIDVDLKKQLTAELPGILLWALEGAARLHQNERFTFSAKCQQANASHRATCFPVYAFLHECTEQTGIVKTRDLWAVYRRWCKAFGLTKPKPMHTFVRDVIGFMPSIQFPRVKHGMAGEIELAGLSLRPGLDIELNAAQAATTDFVHSPMWS